MNSQEGEPARQEDSRPAQQEEAAQQEDVTAFAATPTAADRSGRVRTGADQPWEPEDLVAAQGRDPTPENLARARQQLDEEGAAAIEKTVP